MRVKSSDFVADTTLHLICISLMLELPIKTTYRYRVLVLVVDAGGRRANAKSVFEAL